MAYAPSATQQLQLLNDVQDPSIQAETETLATEGGREARGAIFTRIEVVDFILDAAGYTEDLPLHELKMLEPSCGEGDFLLPVIKRILSAWQRTKPRADPFEALKGSVRAVELHRDTFYRTKDAVIALLVESGIEMATSESLAECWLFEGDFLMMPCDELFDFVIGNPPYVRQELIPPALLMAYRAKYQTMYDRADLYIPFIERSLSLLGGSGVLGFICADRWTKNKYGGPLRRLVANSFDLQAYVDMVDTQPFYTEVSAYPAITIIGKQGSGITKVAKRPSLDKSYLQELARLLRSESPVEDTALVKEIAGVTNGDQPWLLDAADRTAIVRRLEQSYTSLEDAGCKVGIGVATGADKAFIGDYDSLDVEPDRKLPLAMTKDIVSGVMDWKGKGVINPFSETGELVDLDEYPKLKRYLLNREDVIAGRHCAKKNPARWFRTIDKIHPALVKKPKLLIPDIRGSAQIVYEEGSYYPHHNLYFITSAEWNLRALQAVMMSSVTSLFIETYSTKMRGGFLRYQAQYLRRVRLPSWGEVPEKVKNKLIDAACRLDQNACNVATYELYQLNKTEQAALEGKDSTCH